MGVGVVSCGGEEASVGLVDERSVGQSFSKRIVFSFVLRKFNGKHVLTMQSRR